MNTKELEGMFPAGELCLIEITGEPPIEAQRGALAFTDAGIVVTGAWEVHDVHEETNTVDPSPMVGVRFIPWRRIDGISSQCPPSGYATRQDLQDDLERYGVHETVKGEMLAHYELETAAAERKRKERAQRLPAPAGPGVWPSAPRG